MQRRCLLYGTTAVQCVRQLQAALPELNQQKHRGLGGSCCAAGTREIPLLIRAAAQLLHGCNSLHDQGTTAQDLIWTVA